VTYPSQPSDPSETLPAGPLDRRSALALIQRAGTLGGQGEYSEAVPLYQRLVGNRDPDVHVAALLGLAECFYRLDQDDAAIEAWSAATRAPETSITWSAWKQLAAARVRAGDMRGALDAYREAERRAPPNESPEIASRLGWLSKETGNTRAADRYFGKSRTERAYAPIVTYAILATTVGIGLATIFSPGSEDLFIRLFALDKGRVESGELYRLVSVVLVHGGILHLASNMYALFMVGPLVEQMYGRATFALIYVVTAAAASTASFLLLPNDAVGASGAIFGLFGLLALSIRVYKPMLARQARAMASQIGILIIINLVIGFGLAGGGIPIDNTAHIGGLIAGAWLGLIILPRGATTLAGLWQRAGRQEKRGDDALPQDIVPGATPRPTVVTAVENGPVQGRVLRVLGVVLLLILIAIGVTVGPIR
jgi:membrane associated rhomboid family serine protease